MLRLYFKSFLLIIGKNKNAIILIFTTKMMAFCHKT